MLKKTRDTIRRYITTEKQITAPKSSAFNRVVLVFPNSYRIGMSNLGFLTVYRMLNERPDTLCERAFVLDTGEVFSLESRLSLREFDIIAFAVPFESDYLHIPEILRRAGIAPRSAARSEKDPLVMAGGVAVCINPAPVSDFIDLFLVGEAEGLIDPMMDLFSACKESGKEEALRGLSGIESVYVPRVQVGKRVTQHFAENLNRFETCSSIIARDTEFGGKFLVEVSRGCPRGCRFCAARYAYGRTRVRDADAVIRMIERGVQHTDQVGLIGASVSDYPHIDRLCEYLTGRGVKMSISSLRADSARDTFLKSLVKSGQRMITIAPEAGTDRLRSVIGKGIVGEQVTAVAGRAKTCGIQELKLYYMYGLPTETDQDIDAMVREIKTISTILPVKANISPFVPKPHTPFQWCGMERGTVLKEKFARVKAELKHDRRIEVAGEGIKNSLIEAAICRGDRSLSDAIEEKDLQALVSSDRAFQSRGLDELLPWDVIDNGVDKDFLKKEYAEHAK